MFEGDFDSQMVVRIRFAQKSEAKSNDGKMLIKKTQITFLGFECFVPYKHGFVPQTSGLDSGERWEL